MRSRTSRRPWRYSAAALALLGATPSGAEVVGHLVVPSKADPAVQQFNEPSIAALPRNVASDAPLVLYMPGTSGKPSNTPRILQTIAGQGYRVIGLEYDDEPAVVQVCPQDPDPACSGNFREMRLTGSGPGVMPRVTNPPAEAIVPRLIAALLLLERLYPKEGWGQYLNGATLRWDRIVVSGLSQGAGMAAYIAKQHAVRRVVLFSSPWEFTGRDRHPAPWIAAASATPPARWYAEYNQREKTVPLIQAAYAALRIPADHIRVFDLDLPPGYGSSGPNPYHGVTIQDPRYVPQWQAMFGRASDPAE